ncbi:DUF5719 family protein [Demequina sp.]|uniref:DUF5719 family protein n=1 Tax=Demequina sp. TaxID=2050685 RepID=UPI003A85243F
MIRILATVVAVAALLGVATLGAPPHASDAGASASVEVDPVRQAAVCPGPLVIPVGSISSGDEDLDSGSSDVTIAVTPEGTALGEGTSVDSPQAVSVERVGGGDIAGLAGIGCTTPAREQWLVGGSTTVGSSSRLVLSNPTASAVRAQVELFGPVGAVEDVRSVLVGPQSQEALLLESVAAQLPALAVRVTAGGAGVVAALQDSRLDGFVAAGTDWVGPTLMATDQAVPIAGPSAEGAQATLTLLALDDADVFLSLVSSDGEQSWLGEDGLELEGGVVTEVQVPLVDLAAVRIESSTPVAAGARVLVPRESAIDEDRTALDHAWTAAQELGDTRERALVVPEGDITLVAYGPEGGTLTAQAGDEQVTLDTAEFGVGSVALDVAAGTVLSSTDAFAWAIVVEDREAGFVTTIEPVTTELTATTVEATVGVYTP